MSTFAASSSRRLRALGALASVLIIGALASPAAASADGGLPAPNIYNATPSTPCFASEQQPVCGPWTPVRDPNNGFTWGQCTYWAAEKRPDIMNYSYINDPLGNDWAAWTWTEHASLVLNPDGSHVYTVGSTPAVGDIAVWPQSSLTMNEGHVAYVEVVDGDGSMIISEMNAYPNQGDTRLVAATEMQSESVQFISLPHVVPAPSSQPKTVPAPTPPAGAQSMRARVSAVKRHGQTVTFTVQIAARAGSASATAERGRQRARFRARRTAEQVSFAAKLAPGRWALTVTYTPAKGFKAPREAHLTVTVPAGA